MLGPLITRLVLVFGDDVDARAAQNAGDVGVRPGLRGPLELVAGRQVLRLHHVLGELAPQGLPLRTAGLVAVRIAHPGHPPVAGHWLTSMVLAASPVWRAVPVEFAW